jgi:hypothetical protein
MMASIISKLKKYISENSANLYWFLVLVGFLPAAAGGVFSDPLAPVRVSAYYNTFDPILFPVCILLLYFAQALAATRYKFYLSALSLAPMLFALNLLISDINPATELLFKASILIQWAFFIIYGNVLSMYFAVWAIVSLVCALTFVPFFATIIILTISIVARTFYLFVYENFSILKNMKAMQLAKIAIRTLLFFIPIIVIATVWNIYFSAYAKEAAEKELYDEWPELKNSCISQEEKNPIALRVRIACLIDTFYDSQEKAATEPLEKLRGNAKRSLDLVESTTLDAYEKGVPATPGAMVPSLEPPKSCHSFKWGFFKSPCDYKRDALTRLKDSYIQSRTRQSTILRSKLAALKMEAGGNVDRFTDSASDLLKVSITESRIASKAAVKNVFFAIDALTVLFNCSLALAASHGFLMIFSRVSLSGNRGIPIVIGDEGTFFGGKGGDVTDKEDKLTITGASQSTYFTPLSIAVDGREENISVPQPLNAFIGRILHGAYFCNENVVGKQLDNGERKSLGPIIFRTYGGSHFVQWDLCDGEEVIFSFSNLVAFEKAVRFKTIVSLKLSTLVLGRIFFHCATGPGRLILQSRGDPEIGDNAGTSRKVRISQMLAWQRSARFFVYSKVDLQNVYLSGVTVRKEQGGGKGSIAVIDVPERISTGRRIIRVFKRFLLPI